MIVLLPLGATEAHGPHLPLDTDTRIASLLARRCAERLSRRAPARVAEPFVDTCASFAASFPGTISADPHDERKRLVDAAEGLLRQGAGGVVLVNLHFDPGHLRAVREAMLDLQPGASGRVVFPDFTRRAHAAAIGGEFATGACHGGEFETSLMLVAAPDLVGSEFRSLPRLPVDLAAAIRAGKTSFREVGMDRAYCGDPARATAEEGERLLGVLCEIVEKACGDLAALR
ncbi:MAG TPA: creatininase family protein [Candidatus Thermoplasmatota archaeon]|nr:creatininase family protein [Candidatus Thermoplasmatota archaeon]